MAIRAVALYFLLLCIACGDHSLDAALQYIAVAKIADPEIRVSQTPHCLVEGSDRASAQANQKPYYEIEWLVSDTAAGEFTPIELEAGKEFVVTAKHAHKFIRCKAMNFAVTGETTTVVSEPLQVADTLPKGIDVSYFGTSNTAFAVILGVGTGVEDADGDPITGVEVSDVQGGTVDTWSCSEGICTSRFLPTSTLSNGATLFKYKVTNAYGSQSEWATASVKVSGASP